MAYMRPIVQLRNCGTASRAPSNFNSAKTNSSNWIKINSTESLWDLVWKSLSYASAVLNPSSPRRSRATVQAIEEPKERRSQSCPPSLLKQDHVVNNSASYVHESDDKTPGPSTETKVPTEKSYGYFEEAFWEWVGGGKLLDQKKKYLDKEKKTSKIVKPIISKSSLQQRSRFLVRSFNSAISPNSQLLRLEEICKHLLEFPLEKTTMIKDGLLRNILWLRHRTNDMKMLEQIGIALSLLGYHKPPKGNGIRILSIDGGGTRGLMAVEILRQLEQRTNKKVYELFDYICGVSSGAILSFLLGGLRLSPDECEELYYRLSMEIFTLSPFMGTGRLMWNHAYYDTTTWLNHLKEVFEEQFLIETNRQKDTPKISAVSAVMNLPVLRAFVFRNYNYPLHAQSQYLGSCRYKMWECIRATGAAPGYFQEFPLDEYLHQDGGVLINNPAALGIHEARLLWPQEHIQCVISLGSGRYAPMEISSTPSYTSIKTKILKIIDSATDTEGVHITLNDLLSSHTYFRFNPYLTEFLSLDENRPEKLEQLKNDAQMYLRRNEYKFNEAVNVLKKPRSYVKQAGDWIQLQKDRFL